MAEQDANFKIKFDLTNIDAIEKRLQNFISKYYKGAKDITQVAYQFSNSAKSLKSSFDLTTESGEKLRVKLKAVANQKFDPQVTGERILGNIKKEEAALLAHFEKEYKAEARHTQRVEDEQKRHAARRHEKLADEFRKEANLKKLWFEQDYRKLVQHQQSISSLNQKIAINLTASQARQNQIIATVQARGLQNQQTKAANSATQLAAKLQGIAASTAAKTAQTQTHAQASQLLAQTKFNNQTAVNAQRLQNQLQLISARAANKTQRSGSSKTDPLDFYGSALLRQATTIASGILISQTLLKITSSFQGATDAAAQFQIKISEIRTISQKMQISTEQWAAKVRALSDAYGSDAIDTANGVYQALSNQVATSATATGFMAEAMKFAATTVTSTENAVNLLSSGLNSYNLKADQAERVSASFFKLIDLGRVRADEIANSIGTVTVLASQLGISLDDTNAALATMTRSGVEPAKAMTYLRNIFLAMLKPSSELKKTFNAWGVASGDAAFRAYGLVGVMERLSKIMEKGGLTELAENHQNIKTLQGDLLLAGKNLEVFKQGILDFKDAGANYTEAIKIAFESPGKQLEIEFNKIKNLFLFDYGNPIVNNMAKVNKEIISLTTVVDLAIKGFVTLAATSAAYYTLSLFRLRALTAAQITQNSLNAAFGGPQIARMTELQYIFSTISKAAIANPMIALGAATVGVTTATILLSKSTRQYYFEAEAEARKYYNSVKSASEQQLAAQEQKTREAFEAQTKIVYQSLASIRSYYSKLETEADASYKNINKGLVDSTKTFTERFSDSIKNLKSGISDFESSIKSLKKNILDLTAKRDTNEFELGLEDKTPQEKSRLEEKRANELRQQATNKFSQAELDFSQGLFESAKDLRAEAYSLLDQAEELAKRSQKSNNENFHPTAGAAKNAINDEIERRKEIEKTEKRVAQLGRHLIPKTDTVLFNGKGKSNLDYTKTDKVGAEFDTERHYLAQLKAGGALRSQQNKYSKERLNEIQKEQTNLDKLQRSQITSGGRSQDPYLIAQIEASKKKLTELRKPDSSSGSGVYSAEKAKAEKRLEEQIRSEAKSLGIAEQVNKVLSDKKGLLADVQKFEVTKVKVSESDKSTLSRSGAKSGVKNSHSESERTTISDETDKYRKLQENVAELQRLRGLSIKDNRLENDIVSDRIKFAEREKEQTEKKLRADKEALKIAEQSKATFKSLFDSATKPLKTKSTDADLKSKATAIADAQNALKSGSFDKSNVFSTKEQLDLIKSLNQEEEAIRSVIEAKTKKADIDKSELDFKSKTEAARKTITDAESNKGAVFASFGKTATSFVSQVLSSGFTNPTIKSHIKEFENQLNLGDIGKQSTALEKAIIEIQKLKEKADETFNNDVGANPLTTIGNNLFKNVGDQIPILLNNIKEIKTADKTITDAKRKLDELLTQNILGQTQAAAVGQRALESFQKQSLSVSEIVSNTFTSLTTSVESSIKLQQAQVKLFFDNAKKEAQDTKTLIDSLFKNIFTVIDPGQRGNQGESGSQGESGKPERVFSIETQNKRAKEAKQQAKKDKYWEKFYTNQHLEEQKTKQRARDAVVRIYQKEHPEATDIKYDEVLEIRKKEKVNFNNGVAPSIGSQVQTASASNINSSNFGDINITVQGGGTTTETAKAMAFALRRELRRGTVPALT